MVPSKYKTLFFTFDNCITNTMTRRKTKGQIGTVNMRKC